MRRTGGRPACPRTPGALGALASAVHCILYGLLLTMALSGWAMVSASPLIRIFPIRNLGTLPWPAMGFLENPPPPRREVVHTQLEALHLFSAWLLGALVGLHAMAALTHHYLFKDNVLVRMVRLSRSRRDGI